METDECPRPGELGRFAVGALPAAEIERIAAHLEVCAECDAALTECDAARDPLLERLRRSLDAALPTAVFTLPAASPPGLPGVPPRRLAHFELIEPLGSGSFGHVFKARDAELGREVAVKVLAADPAGGDRFTREAQSAARLKHPGIVTLHGAGRTDDGVWYLVQEFIDGESLAAHMARRRFGRRDAARLVMEIARALDYAHQKGVIHRDIKPSNVLLDADGHPHLADFGLAKWEDDERPVTLDGQLLGTPAYMSPEQARGENDRVGPRSDTYSLGVVLYELLTGGRPFAGNRQTIIRDVVQAAPTPPRQFDPEMPRDLETICLKAMAKSPAARYATAGEMADDLGRFLDGKPTRARPLNLPQRVANWARRRPGHAAMVVVCSLAVASVVAVLGVSYARTQDALGRERRANEQLRRALIRNARLTSDALCEFNELYTSEVVSRLRDHPELGVEVTHDYRDRPGAIPLPATLSSMLGERLAARGGPMHIRLYSDYPFPWRADGGPRDDFEREALAALRADPGRPFVRVEPWHGQDSIRYATASRLKRSCVDCHNSHPDSPKTDWREGDTRGVFEVIVPIEPPSACP